MDNLNKNSTAVMETEMYNYFIPLATNVTTAFYSPGMQISVITEKTESYAGDSETFAVTNHQQVPFTYEQSEEYGIGTYSKIGVLSTTTDAIAIPQNILIIPELSYIEKAIVSRALEIKNKNGHPWVFIFDYQDKVESLLKKLGITPTKIKK